MDQPHPLRTYRESKNLSVAALALVIGVKRATVYRWEARQRVIDRDLLPRIVEKTGIPADQLLELDRLTGAAA